MKRIKRQSQANRQLGSGTLRWSLHFRKCTHKSTWHRLPEIRGLVYFWLLLLDWPNLLMLTPVTGCVPVRFHKLSSAVTHHQVAVNPQAGPHTVPPCWEKMRCNPPSMKSAFLFFPLSCFASCTSLSLYLSPLQTHSPSNFYSYGS